MVAIRVFDDCVSRAPECVIRRLRTLMAETGQLVVNAIDILP